jgi:uncharacterized protein (TIGR00251 family)
MSCYRRLADGIVLSVRIVPRANRNAVDGIIVLADGRSAARIRVRAVPEDGAANAALVAVLAKALGRPKSVVTIISGATQRLKQVRIAGDPEKLAAVVSGWEGAEG